MGTEVASTKDDAICAVGKYDKHIRYGHTRSVGMTDSNTNDGATRAIFYRRFPCFANFEGRQVEVVLQVYGMGGVVVLLAGK